MRRIHIPLLFLLAASVSVTGCTIRPSAGSVEERMNPAGIRVQVFLSDTRAPGGELLSITPGEIGILTPLGVAMLPSESVDRIKVDGSARIVQVDRESLVKKDVDRLRPLSRFPAGIPVEVLDRLIDMYGSYSLESGEADS